MSEKSIFTSTYRYQKPTQLGFAQFLPVFSSVAKTQV